MEEAKKPEEKKGQIFLQLPGVEGVSREKGYEGWLRAQTYQFGVGCGVSRGGGYGRRRRRAPPPTEGDAPKVEEEVILVPVICKKMLTLFYKRNQNPSCRSPAHQ